MNYVTARHNSTRTRRTISRRALWAARFGALALVALPLLLSTYGGGIRGGSALAEHPAPLPARAIDQTPDPRHIDPFPPFGTHSRQAPSGGEDSAVSESPRPGGEGGRRS